MSSIYQKIGKRVREERKLRNLSMVELGERAKLVASFISQIERGDRKLSVASLEKIAIALGLAPWELIKDVPAKSSVSPESSIALLLKNQPAHRKMLILKTLKFIFRNLRGV